VAARLGFGAAGAGGPAASGLIVSAIRVTLWWHVRFFGQVDSHLTSQPSWIAGRDIMEANYHNE